MVGFHDLLGLFTNDESVQEAGLDKVVPGLSCRLGQILTLGRRSRSLLKLRFRTDPVQSF